MTKWRGEICKRCQRRNCVGFIVRFSTVWCLTCFDKVAEHKEVRYKLLDTTFPVAWWQWEEDE